jgi:predicted helicase
MNIQEVPWFELNPSETKDYWFVKKDFTGTEVYNKFTSIVDIFSQYSSGIEGRRDSFCIKYSLSGLNNLKEELSNNNIQTIRDKYGVTDSRDWSLESAIKDIKSSYNPTVLCYRPFDFRYTSISKLSNRFIGYSFYEVMQHFDNKDNIGISFVRQLSDAKPYSNVLVSQYPIERRANYSFQGGAFIAPLYIYGENLDGEHPGEMSKVPNYTQSFKETYLNTISWEPSPEDVLAYIYAVLHSTIYRTKYIVFLKTAFPAIPMTRDKAVFDKYAAQGKMLIDLHLLKNLPTDNAIKVSLGEAKGDFFIDKLTYANDKIHLSVLPANQSSHGGLITFEGVTLGVCDFEIGSRKPVDLWIKHRIKDKVPLKIEDLQHIKNMIISIKQTIIVMEEIILLGEEYLNDI